LLQDVILRKEGVVINASPKVSVDSRGSLHNFVVPEFVIHGASKAKRVNDQEIGSKGRIGVHTELTPGAFCIILLSPIHGASKAKRVNDQEIGSKGRIGVHTEFIGIRVDVYATKSPVRALVVRVHRPIKVPRRPDWTEIT
jgi:hypothetical protein